MGKIKAWFEKNKRKNKDGSVTVESEYEKVTNQLIQETVGPRGVLQKEFEKKIKNYNAENNPLGETEVKTILFSLIELAIAQRRVLAQRIERSVECGNIFEQYFGKIEEINKLDCSTQVKMKKMQVAREAYEAQAEIYKEVTGNTYEREENLGGQGAKKATSKDPWEEMDEEGGVKYDESSK